MSTFVALQKVIPQRILTELAGKLAQVRWPPLKNFLIRSFRKAYNVDLRESKIKDAEDFPSFNAFFTRELEDGARPISASENLMVSPADGYISELGVLHREYLLQAKNIYYSASELVADNILGAALEAGSFATVYLSPRDYHRVHVPIAGKLLSLTYVPGKLFSVNDKTARSLEGLFTNNERLVAQFQTEEFTYALVMVGAMIVGGMETVVTGQIKRRQDIIELNVESGKTFAKGEEFGRFHLGSTAIVVLPPEAGVVFDVGMQKGMQIRMGESLATFGELA